MKLLYVADGRSPIALNWIRYFIQRGDEVHLVSTYACPQIEGLASQVVVPLGMSELAGNGSSDQTAGRNFLRQLVPVQLRTRFRQWVTPTSIPKAARVLQAAVRRFQPDLMHAMRIPYEGMLASEALKLIKREQPAGRPPPFLVSVWGNDFTLHARSTPAVASYTRQVLAFADGLHADCRRDQRMAFEFGYAITKPSVVLPGAGGIQADLFHPAETLETLSRNLAEKNEVFRVINPRGYRAYVRNDTFFQAIPLVLKDVPYVLFTCPGMYGERDALRWIRKLGIDEQVELLPIQSRPQMAELFRASQVSLSITTHDGTPNTLLEAMACGCFPIAGDIESLREWITPGENGLLVDPSDPQALAQAIIHASSHPKLRQQAKKRNLDLVEKRAKYEKVMSQAEGFYQRLIDDFSEIARG
jgi:glycosyltransferase involved in cell wall biosynthesis